MLGFCLRVKCLSNPNGEHRFIDMMQLQFLQLSTHSVFMTPLSYAFWPLTGLRQFNQFSLCSWKMILARQYHFSYTLHDFASSTKVLLHWSNDSVLLLLPLCEVPILNTASLSVFFFCSALFFYQFQMTLRFCV